MFKVAHKFCQLLGFQVPATITIRKHKRTNIIFNTSHFCYTRVVPLHFLSICETVTVTVIVPHMRCITTNACNFKVTFLHGCFSRFLNCTNGTKSSKTFHMIIQAMPKCLIIFTKIKVFPSSCQKLLAIESCLK